MSTIDLTPKPGSIMERVLRLGMVYDHEETKTGADGTPQTVQVWQKYDAALRAEFVFTNGDETEVKFTDTDTHRYKTAKAEEVTDLAEVSTWRSEYGAPGTVTVGEGSTLSLT